MICAEVHREQKKKRERISEVASCATNRTVRERYFVSQSEPEIFDLSGGKRQGIRRCRVNLTLGDIVAVI